MKKAIDMTQFYMNQYRYVLAKCSPAQSLTGDILKIRDLLNKTQSLTITQIKDRFKHLRSKDGRGIILNYFDTLVNLGFAQWEISGKRIRTNQERNQDKSGKNQEAPKTIYTNVLKVTEKMESGQIRKESGQLKTIYTNGLDTESGKNNNFNYYFSNSEVFDTEENISEDNSPSVPNSYKYDGSLDDFWDDNNYNSDLSPKCPDLPPKTSQGMVSDCPDSFLTFPDGSPEVSQGMVSDCPDYCPDFKENVLTYPQVGQKWNYRKIDGSITTIEIKYIKNDGTLVTTELLSNQIICLREESPDLLNLVESECT
jgi:hypothetical protein